MFTRIIRHAASPTSETESEDSDYYALAYYSMSSPKRVFGISLEFLRRRGQMRQGVPVVLLQMVEFLDQYGLHQSELFHASRSEARRNELKKSLNRGEFQCFRSSDAHAVASLLILFLRELPYGLIPCWNATRFLRVYTMYQKTPGHLKAPPIATVPATTAPSCLSGAASGTLCKLNAKLRSHMRREE
ncbi:protein FAM13A [Labeo rohita]|uniref:protein FAM13A n=1 Tax=Labeo rohita TaxID=84645 RepID=UPI0021E28E6F|nr:protein FAM13A [Labeo rohita]